jgi:hypothetical protein
MIMSNRVEAYHRPINHKLNGLTEGFDWFKSCGKLGSCETVRFPTVMNCVIRPSPAWPCGNDDGFTMLSTQLKMAITVLSHKSKWRNICLTRLRSYYHDPYLNFQPNSPLYPWVRLSQSTQELMMRKIFLTPPSVSRRGIQSGAH